MEDEFRAFFTGATAGGVSSILANPIGNDILQMIEDHALQADVTGAVACSLMLALAAAPRSMVIKQANDLREPTFLLRENQAFNASNFATMPEGQEKAFAIMFFQAYPSARQWLLDLTACHQVRALNGQNIQGYFMSMNGTYVRGAAMVQILETAKNKIMNIVGDEYLRNQLTKNKFMEYHTAFSSTPGLVVRATEDLKEVIAVSDETQDKLEMALSNYWDSTVIDQIPQSLVAVTHAYLSVMRALPEGWIQGEKAKTNTGILVYRRWLVLITRWSELVKNTDGIERASSIAELVASVPRDSILF
jgi:hypothetical protein